MQSKNQTNPQAKAKEAPGQDSKSKKEQENSVAQPHTQATSAAGKDPQSPVEGQVQVNKQVTSPPQSQPPPPQAPSKQTSNLGYSSQGGQVEDSTMIDTANASVLLGLKNREQQQQQQQEQEQRPKMQRYPFSLREMSQPLDSGLPSFAKLLSSQDGPFDCTLLVLQVPTNQNEEFRVFALVDSNEGKELFDLANLTTLLAQKGLAKHVKATLPKTQLGCGLESYVVVFCCKQMVPKSEAAKNLMIDFQTESFCLDPCQVGHLSDLMKLLSGNSETQALQALQLVTQQPIDKTDGPISDHTQEAYLFFNENLEIINELLTTSDEDIFRQRVSCLFAKGRNDLTPQAWLGFLMGVEMYSPTHLIWKVLCLPKFARSISQLEKLISNVLRPVNVSKVKGKVPKDPQTQKAQQKPSDPCQLMEKLSAGSEGLTQRQDMISRVSHFSMLGYQDAPFNDKISESYYGKKVLKLLKFAKDSFLQVPKNEAFLKVLESVSQSRSPDFCVSVNKVASPDDYEFAKQYHDYQKWLDEGSQLVYRFHIESVMEVLLELLPPGAVLLTDEMNEKEQIRYILRCELSTAHKSITGLKFVDIDVEGTTEDDEFQELLIKYINNNPDKRLEKLLLKCQRAVAGSRSPGDPRKSKRLQEKQRLDSERRQQEEESRKEQQQRLKESAGSKGKQPPKKKRSRSPQKQNRGSKAARESTPISKPGFDLNQYFVQEQQQFFQNQSALMQQQLNLMQQQQQHLLFPQQQPLLFPQQQPLQSQAPQQQMTNQQRGQRQPQMMPYPSPFLGSNLGYGAGLVLGAGIGTGNPNTFNQVAFAQGNNLGQGRQSSKPRRTSSKAKPGQRKAQDQVRFGTIINHQDDDTEHSEKEAQGDSGDDVQMSQSSEEQKQSVQDQGDQKQDEDLDLPEFHSIVEKGDGSKSLYHKIGQTLPLSCLAGTDPLKFVGREEEVPVQQALKMLQSYTNRYVFSSTLSEQQKATGQFQNTKSLKNQISDSVHLLQEEENDPANQEKVKLLAEEVRQQEKLNNEHIALVKELVKSNLCKKIYVDTEEEKYDGSISRVFKDPSFYLPNDVAALKKSNICLINAYNLAVDSLVYLTRNDALKVHVAYIKKAMKTTQLDFYSQDTLPVASGKNFCFRLSNQGLFALGIKKLAQYGHFECKQYAENPIFLSLQFAAKGYARILLHTTRTSVKVESLGTTSHVWVFKYNPGAQKGESPYVLCLDDSEPEKHITFNDFLKTKLQLDQHSSMKLYGIETTGPYPNGSEFRKGTGKTAERASKAKETYNQVLEELKENGGKIGVDTMVKAFKECDYELPKELKEKCPGTFAEYRKAKLCETLLEVSDSGRQDWEKLSLEKHTIASLAQTYRENCFYVPDSALFKERLTDAELLECEDDIPDGIFDEEMQ